jgi:hypothetical protein
MEAYMAICWYIPKKVFATFVVPSFLVHVMVFYNMDYVFFIEISINKTNPCIIYCMLVTLKHGMPSTTTYKWW